ncbi:MAG: hypothetical protein K8Q97_01710 [Candidatus Andersenbacteria bacterium]|nr:hypothetical protein [Candidatus Andersenbacteria bacterium]
MAGFGIIIKHDPFWLIRPLGRYAGKLAKRFIGACYKFSKRSTVSLWKIMTNQHKAIITRIVCGIAMVPLAITTALLFLPADLIGSGKK